MTKKEFIEKHAWGHSVREEHEDLAIFKILRSATAHLGEEDKVEIYKDYLKVQGVI